MDVPETKYVRVGGADVAYQVFGDGAADLLYFYGLGSHIDLTWDLPDGAEFQTQLASFSRVVMFDRRGCGASDALGHGAIPTWEEWTEDIGGVLDAAGSERAAILAAVDVGPIAILFAAMHPERVSALILLNTLARYLVAEDYPMGKSPEELDAFVAMLESIWGTEELVLAVDPGLADDPETVRKLARQIRASATPRTAAAQYDYLLRILDVREALSLIQAPTLVLHVRESPMAPIEHGRYLASHIPGARFVELPGADTAVTANRHIIAEEIAHLLTGERPVFNIDRVLTTVLFTDIVDSTKRAASLGDDRWRSLLDTHDRAVRDQLNRFRGREIKTTGDGFVASFDGPARAIRCARSILETSRTIGIELRAGLHTGECLVRGDDLGGMAVHIAARVGSLAAAGDVLVSGTVKDLVVGSGIEFEERGEHELKGVPGSWKLFAVGG